MLTVVRGVTDAGRSARQDHIVALTARMLNQFQRDHVCLKTCDIHDSGEL